MKDTTGTAPSTAAVDRAMTPRARAGCSPDADMHDSEEELRRWPRLRGHLELCRELSEPYAIT